MTRVFAQGEEVIFNATFYSDKLKTIPVDPTTVTLSIQKPDGSIVDGGAAEDGARPDNTGMYTASYIVDDFGNYDWRWETATPLFIRQGTIKVNPNLVS